MVELAPEIPDPATAPRQVMADSIGDMVGHPDYPCLGARSVFRRDRATVRVYAELNGSATASQLLADLREFAVSVDSSEDFASFVAVFRSPAIEDEQHFERLLWSQLGQLHECDDQSWSPEVSSDPTDPHFAFSAAGTAYFVVGLHPQASRDARRAAAPTLVFNLHQQFEALRESGGFALMRDKIRDRDEQLQGYLNPMVSDHGQTSEASQYSGREVADGWGAPLGAAPFETEEHA